MSREYDLYLQEHCGNVLKGFQWINTNCPQLIPDGEYGEIFKTIMQHDASKFNDDEYPYYDDYFYLKKDSRSFEVVNNFNQAFLMHIHRNPHHWQYWVLINDTGEKEKQIIFDMPYKYIIEMICDWWSFSWSSNNLREMFSWWEKNKNDILLSHSTFVKVNMILLTIDNKLKELEELSNEA